MIQRFNRYPLIVDPSGQATEFLLSEYRNRKITKTRLVRRGENVRGKFVILLQFFWCLNLLHSLMCVCVPSFLDDAFRKNLESALRFGNPLLVQV